MSYYYFFYKLLSKSIKICIIFYTILSHQSLSMTYNDEEPSEINFKQARFLPLGVIQKCADLSHLSYRENRDYKEVNSIKEDGSKVECFKGKTGLIQIDSNETGKFGGEEHVLGLVLFKKNNNYFGRYEYTIVSFHGTENLNDILTDLKIFWRKDTNKIGLIDGKCHRGFYMAYMSCKEELNKILRDNLKIEDSKNEIIFTGHSLGAALAQIAAADIYNEWKKEWNFDNRNSHIKVITFGSPKTFNWKARKSFDELIGQNNHLRFYSHMDFITYLPPIPYLYEHTGKDVFISFIKTMKISIEKQYKKITDSIRQTDANGLFEGVTPIAAAISLSETIEKGLEYIRDKENSPLTEQQEKVLLISGAYILLQSHCFDNYSAGHLPSERTHEVEEKINLFRNDERIKENNEFIRRKSNENLTSRLNYLFWRGCYDNNKWLSIEKEKTQ